MSLDIRALLEETGALLAGHFRLSSGLHSSNYVQCARLLELPSNARRIGEALAARIVDVPDRVVAPALGGLIVGYAVAEALGRPFVFTERKDGAMALRRGFTIAQDETVLIVEDVVTTGKSTRETTDVIEQLGGRVTAYASILNRSGVVNPFDREFLSLLMLDLPAFEVADCPLCRDGVSVDAPGSRFTAR